MSLYKTGTLSVIPGDPGVEAVSPRLAKEAYCVRKEITEITYPPGGLAPPSGQNTNKPFSGDGYEPGYIGPTSFPTKTVRYEDTCYPATPAVPGVTGVPPTAGQIATNNNQGWNAWSRSINPIDLGDYIVYTLSVGIHGCFIGLGMKGVDGRKIGVFTHGIVVDATGIHVLEGGVVKATLRDGHTAESYIRIVRQEDNSIVYVVTTGSQTVVYKSLVANPISGILPLYAYSYLYSVGDVVLTSEIDEGEVGFGSCTMTGSGTMSGFAGQVVTMSGSGEMIIQDYAVIMSGSGTMTGTPSQQGSCTMTGEGAMTGIPSWGGGNAMMAPFASIGSETGDYAFGNANTQAFTGEAEESDYVPQRPQYGYGNMSPFFSTGFMTTIDVANGSAEMAPFGSLGGDYEYGFSSQNMAPFNSFAIFGKEFEASMFSYAYAVPEISTNQIMVIAFMSTGQAESLFVTTMVIPQNMISSAVGGSLFTVLGVFNVSMLSTGLVSTLLGTETEVDGTPKADLDNLAQVWVVNMKTGASVQYEQFGYNSWFKRESDGKFFGVAGNGIFELVGDDDDGTPIASYVDFGLSDFGINQIKAISEVYYGVASSGKLYLKLVADGVDYTYRARDNDTEMKKQRFDVGKGLRGGYWNFELINPDGHTHELDTIHFEPIPTTRVI